MTEDELKKIEARVDAFDSSRSMDDVTIIESVTEFITSAPADLRALLLEVRRMGPVFAAAMAFQERFDSDKGMMFDIAELLNACRKAREGQG